MKGEIDRKNNLISQLLTTHSNSFNIANTKKIEHIEKFWNSIIQIREINYGTEFIYSFLLDSEIEKLYTDQGIGSKNIREQYLTKISANYSDTSDKASKIKSEIDKQRPFIGEKLFSLFYVYFTFSMRSTYLLIKDSSQGKCNIWKSDSALIKNLQDNLNEAELEYLKSKDFGSYQTAIALLEAKMTNEIHYSLTGEEAVDNSIKQVEKLESLLKLTK